MRDSRGVDLFVGLPEEHEQRVLDLQPTRLPSGYQDPGPEPAAPDSLPGIAFTVPVDDLGRLTAVNSRRWRAAGPASGGGMASARGLARLYACSITAVDGQPPLLAPDTAAEFAQVHSSGHDMVMLAHLASAWDSRSPLMSSHTCPPAPSGMTEPAAAGASPTHTPHWVSAISGAARATPAVSATIAHNSPAQRVRWAARRRTCVNRFFRSGRRRGGGAVR